MIILSNRFKLNEKEPVEALNAKRLLSTEKQQVQVMGGEAECKVLQSPGFIVNMARGILHKVMSGTKLVGRIHLVDPGRSQEAGSGWKEVCLLCLDQRCSHQLVSAELPF
jgi:hypothetical protein